MYMLYIAPVHAEHPRDGVAQREHGEEAWDGRRCRVHRHALGLVQGDPPPRRSSGQDVADRRPGGLFGGGSGWKRVEVGGSGWKGVEGGGRGWKWVDAVAVRPGRE